MTRLSLSNIARTQLREALTAAMREFLYDPNVRMIDFGYRRRGGRLLLDEVAIRVHVLRKLAPDDLAQAAAHGRTRPIPQSIRGYATDVHPCAFRLHDLAAADMQARRARATPMVGGISVSTAARSSAGTLGGLVFDRQDRGPMILSNWHVLAGSTAILPGARIVQPGSLDGGTDDDQVGTYARDAMNANLDAAVARIDGSRALSDTLLDLAAPKGVAGAELGMEVAKSGRTTGVTRGRVTAIDGSLRMDYPGFEREIRSVVSIGELDDGEGLCDDGDSGALWLDAASGAAVALHFAGTVMPVSAVAMDLQAVLDALQVDLATSPDAPSG